MPKTKKKIVKKPAKKVVAKKALKVVVKKATKKQVVKREPTIKRLMTSRKKRLFKLKNTWAKILVIISFFAVAFIGVIVVNNQFLAVKDSNRSVLGSTSVIKREFEIGSSWTEIAANGFGPVSGWVSSNKKVVQVFPNKDKKSAVIRLVGLGDATITVKYPFWLNQKIDIFSQRGKYATPVSGFDTSYPIWLDETNGVKIRLEKGCRASVANSFKDFYKTMPRYLRKNITEVDILNIENGSGYAVATVAVVSCSNYSPGILVHEASHIWDGYEKGSLAEINDDDDFTKLYNSYGGIWVNYNYNKIEWFATIYTQYYDNYLKKLGDDPFYKMANWYPMPNSVKSYVQGAIRKYGGSYSDSTTVAIQVSGSGNTTQPATPVVSAPTNPGKITYAKWYNKNSKEARLIGSEVAQVKFMSDTLQDGYTMTCYNNSGTQISDSQLPNKLFSADSAGNKYRYSNDYYTYTNRKCYVGGYKSIAGKNVWGTAKEITN